jgi:deoxyadenosine/deoxycytidine kinase
MPQASIGRDQQYMVLSESGAAMKTLWLLAILVVAYFMSNYPYVAFEGPIAAGKTTISTLLATHLRSELILEDFENNEFLGDFYTSHERWSLPMQLWFLAARVPALKSITRPGPRPLIADYTARKDPLFARLLLNGRELRLFNRIAAIIAAEVTQPDLIVYLDANNDVLLDRIKHRGRPYEERIDGAYLHALRNAYDDDLTDAGLNVLRYDTSALDLKSGIQLRQLYDLIVASVPNPRKYEWPQLEETRTARTQV